MKKKLISIVGTILVVAIICITIVSVSSTSAYAQTSNYIENKMASLMTEIDELIKSNDQMAMSSNPYDYIKNSQDYEDIVGTGVKAVKPLYDMLYKSPDAGLYEYILALAIEDITAQEYVYNVDYGWKNSLEFRMCYEMKVNNSTTQFERIMNTGELTEDEKIQSITELGVFAVDCLLDEYDKDDSLLPKNVIEKSFANIMSNAPTEKSSFSIQDLSVWRVENEEAYRSLKVLNGKSYED
jgi:hypothetical protein